MKNKTVLSGPIVWRDDDILMRPHTLNQLLRVDDLIQSFGQVHTIAIISSTLTPELGAVIRERGMSAQLHCWEHDDLSIDENGSIAELPRAVGAIEDMVGVRPTVLYPTWNRTSPRLEDAAAELGLTVSWRKVSMSQYVRVKGFVEEEVINFHFWEFFSGPMTELSLLDLALRFHRENNRAHADV